MLISRVSDESRGDKGRAGAESGDHVPEYQTASELFALMTKNTHFDVVEDHTLTTQDLVLLYKNIDIGTKLMNDAGVKRKKPNQYVETIVYNDEPESESDLTEMYSAEDMRDLFTANQERLDFLNNQSLENLLCPKFGGIEMQSSLLSTDYDNFFFKDPYYRNHFKNFNVMPASSEFSNLFPTSLIDYICCKHLEDNYNFYMDNIITYVQVTIEQLKRISNGDYLTDRVKEKWMEVNSDGQENNTKVLATSTSMPLHVQCKQNGSIAWDDIVHSEVDVRSLSKILEKKIVVEIPKLICGSYRLYSKQCEHNLVISCQREDPQIDKSAPESRVDVMLQLQRSQSGQVMSHIRSIMILRTSPAFPDLCGKEVLPMICNVETNKEGSNIGDSPGYITEVSNDCSDAIVEELETKRKNHEKIQEKQTLEYQELSNEDSTIGTDNYPFIDERHQNVSSIISRPVQGLGSKLAKTRFPISSNETTFNLISPDELRMTMQRLNTQFSVLHEGEEETTRNSSPKRRSPVRARIKSPYENKTYLMEEKKRKRLLEIRERREKNKIALSENCKISKHKYGKGALMPQASNSVTKLSITNKSFYNSIYGQSFNADNKPKSDKSRKSQKNMVTPATPDLSSMELIDAEYFKSPMLTPDKNNQKYTNRSYYLDDAETEIMYIQTKKNVNKNAPNECSRSNSGASNEFNVNLNLLSQLIEASEINLNNDPKYLGDDQPRSLGGLSCSGGDSLLVLPLLDCEVSTITPNHVKNELISNKKNSSSDECRKSIDEVYDLIKTFGKPHPDSRVTKCKGNFYTNNTVSCSTIQGSSDSGTSIKHYITNSSNHSCFSGEKNEVDAAQLNSNVSRATVVPKVIISSKFQPLKTEVGRIKIDRRRTNVTPPIKRVPDNPLKAISQLLHEFDTVQKTRQKSVVEIKAIKKTEAALNDAKTSPRQCSYRRRSRLDQHLKDNQEKKASPTHASKEKRARPMLPGELSRVPHLQSPVEDKNYDKFTKRKIADIIDEAKEARGEAVRGPSKLNSRLNSLAQPKRSYVQAHHEEYQNRYGKTILAERLQRLAAPPLDRSVASSTLKNKGKRGGTDGGSLKQPPISLHLDKSPKNMKLRRSPSTSSHEQFKWQPLASTINSGPDAPEPLDSRKMVAVESYVKNHYGPASSDGPLLTGKPRVPLVPQDLDLASMSLAPTAYEATQLGHTLHRMTGSMLPSGASLTALTEGPESTSKEAGSDPDSLSPGHSDTDSDYHFDILEKNHRAAVETVDESQAVDPDPSVYSDHNPPPANSTAELEKLENALYTQISGAFQKRLRIKNLTLTPKHSMQQVFLVQSGDAGSLLLKTTVSNLKVNKCSAESLHDLKALPVLSNSHMDWTFAQIPIQIATVGYAIPQYQNRKATGSQVRLLETPPVNCKNAENQCVTQKKLSHRGAQVDVEKDIAAFRSPNGNVPHMPAEMGQVRISNQTSIVLETVTELGSIESDANKIREEPGISIKDEETNITRAPSPEPVDYTTSLDMLVGLLNEIQKITCQDQMAAANVHTYADLETIFNDAVGLENKSKYRDIISMTSLDNLRKLESNASIYSCYISNGGDTVESNLEPRIDEAEITLAVLNKSAEIQHPNEKLIAKKFVDENIATEVFKPPTADKEVSADFSEKEYVNTLTNVSLSLAPIAAGNGPGVSVAVGVIREPSTQSILPCIDYQTLYCNRHRTVSDCINEIVELDTQVEINEQHMPVSRDKTDLNEKCMKTSSADIEVIKQDKNLIARSKLKTYCVKNINFDPMFKIKRDILVTVYSILVLTVFAALSFPELIIFQ